MFTRARAVSPFSRALNSSDAWGPVLPYIADAKWDLRSDALALFTHVIHRKGLLVGIALTLSNRNVETGWDRRGKALRYMRSLGVPFAR